MSVGDVAGPVAASALDALVAQFADQAAFVRELVQNSLDAGSGRVDVVFDAGPSGEDALVIDVIDDGEGMDRATIEGCLLTLFRSSKERDLTKIGKFGVGFVSLFALSPRQVVVDTAKDGVHHRVVFARDRSWTLFESDEPFEGTRVRIHTDAVGSAARELSVATDGALVYWCRFARAEIYSEATHPAWGWDLRAVEGVFGVDAPVTVSVDRPGLRAVLGVSGSDTPAVAFHNRGLTLLEGRENTLPGVTFRVEAPTLEHTLTRDNVLRDADFRAVVAQLSDLARQELAPAWEAALRKAVADRDDVRRQALLAASHPDVTPVPRELPCLLACDHTFVSLDDLDQRRGLLGLRGRQPIWCAPLDSPLARAATGPVLAGPDTIDATVVARQLGRAPVRLGSKYCVAIPEKIDQHGIVVVAAADELCRAGSELTGLTGARLHPAPTERTLAIRQREPGRVRPISGGQCDEDGLLMVNLDDPLLETLSALPPQVGAVLLVRSCLSWADGTPLLPELADALQAALEEVTP